MWLPIAFFLTALNTNTVSVESSEVNDIVYVKELNSLVRNIQHGNTSEVKKLLKKPRIIKKINYHSKRYSISPATAAFTSPHSTEEIATMVLNAEGVDVNSSCSGYRMILYYALQNRMLTNVKKILAMGVDVAKMDIVDKSNAFHYVALWATRDVMDIVKKLVENSDKEKRLEAIMHKNQDGDTPFTLAIKIRTYRLDVVKALIDVAGANPCEIFENGNTALHLTYCPQIAEFLWNKVPNLKEVRNKMGRTPLLEAALIGNYKMPMIRAMITNGGVDIKAVDNKENNIFHLLNRRYWTIKFVQFFVENGADGKLMDAKNADGETPITKSLKYDIGSFSIHSIRTSERFEPSLDYPGIYEPILKVGASANEPNGFGEYPLQIAVRFIDVAITEILIRNGANVLMMDLKGDMPYDELRKMVPIPHHLRNNYDKLLLILKITEMMQKREDYPLGFPLECRDLIDFESEYESDDTEGYQSKDDRDQSNSRENC